MDSSKSNNSKLISERTFLEDEETKKNVKKVISSLITNRDAWPFREPVNEKDAPNYYDIIKSPMDLSIINQKLEKKIYSNFQELESDMRLIVNNSEIYNGQFNGFTTNAYSVWRNFRRLTKKYLNHDLSIEDKNAFIYPPRYNSTGKIASSKIGKKRKKQKKSNKFQALELLYNATQDSIESTFQKFAISPMSDNENKDDNLPKNYEFSSEDKQLQEFYNESFAKLDNHSHLNGYYTEKNRNENLVFKSLNEWNKEIDKNGQSIILPDKTVLCINSPVEKNWLTNFPNDQPNYKTVFNKEMFRQPINGQLQNGQLILTQESNICKKKKRVKRKRENKSCKDSSEISSDQIDMKNESGHKASIISENLSETDLIDLSQTMNTKKEDQIESNYNSKKRLVIKLSKLNNNFYWKPIKNTHDQQSNDSDSDSVSDSDSDSDYDLSSETSSCTSSCLCDNDN